MIKGICRVNGDWTATYKRRAVYITSFSVTHVPVACWAEVLVLVEEFPDGLNDYKREVHGMVVHTKLGTLVDAEELEGFEGYEKL